MSWREFIASLVGSLAWPAVGVVAIVVFRRQLQALLEGPITRWRLGPLEFERKWAEATESVAEKVVTRDALSAHSSDIDDLLELAEKAPVPAILAAHNAVEEAVRQIAAAAGIDGTGQKSIGQLAEVLSERGLVDARTASALHGLVALRNLAAHGPPPEGKRAREYIVIADAVLYSLSHSKAAPSTPTASSSS